MSLLVFTCLFVLTLLIGPQSRAANACHSVFELAKANSRNDPSVASVISLQGFTGIDRAQATTLDAFIERVREAPKNELYSVEIDDLAFTRQELLRIRSAVNERALIMIQLSKNFPYWSSVSRALVRITDGLDYAVARRTISYGDYVSLSFMLSRLPTVRQLQALLLRPEDQAYFQWSFGETWKLIRDVTPATVSSGFSTDHNAGFSTTISNSRLPIPILEDLSIEVMNLFSIRNSKFIGLLTDDSGPFDSFESSSPRTFWDHDLGHPHGSSNYAETIRAIFTSFPPHQITMRHFLWFIYWHEFPGEPQYKSPAGLIALLRAAEPGSDTFRSLAKRASHRFDFGQDQKLANDFHSYFEETRLAMIHDLEGFRFN